ncbi:RIP metalloprotease RseP [Lyngbya confervoides]|uniref:Zinc metalloprotease n=1 Tax=Lyngbya confervoides BDU141951 TaxID=1574623 RepID=A0ABD4T335_9CYAN|nr:RIP metalloprotease RseP [Lyngbya confervoides]MCM1982647.1 RIP metalloprotease RseP [Lyngbya confervoides BDU141951]
MPVLAAIAVVGILIVVHELGHFLAARLQGIIVTRFAIGFGPVLWRYQGRVTEYSLRAIPLGGYVAFPDDELEEDLNSSDPGLLKNRPILDRAIVMVAGVLANLIFAYLLLMTQLGTVGIPEFQPQPGVQIPQLVSTMSSAAGEAGLQAMDVVIQVNGQPLPPGSVGIDRMQEAILSSQGSRLELLVLRDQEQLEFSVAPQIDEDGIPRIGVQLAPNGQFIFHKATHLTQLINQSNQEFERISRLTVLGFAHLISNFQEAASQLSGPVAIVAMGADIAKSNAGNLLQFAALISINLAFINILPLPALDGGQLLFLAFEGIRGKPLPVQFQQGVMQTGLFLIMGLGVLLIVRDTANLSWVQQLMQ